MGDVVTIAPLSTQTSLTSLVAVTLFDVAMTTTSTFNVIVTQSPPVYALTSLTD